MGDRDRTQAQQLQVHHTPPYRHEGGREKAADLTRKKHTIGSSSSAIKVLSVVALLPIAGTLLAVSGLTLVGSLIGLAVATPLLVIFSPVLVPAVLAIGLMVAAFIASWALGLTGLTSFGWLFKSLRRRSESVAEDMKRRVQEAGVQMEQKTKEAGQAMIGLTFAVVTLVPIAGALLVISGQTLVGSLVGLAVATPLFVIFSPVLVPAVLAIGLTVAAFIASEALGLTGLTSIEWLFKSLRRRSESVAEDMKSRVQETGVQMGQKTKEAGQAIQQKALEEGGGGGGGGGTERSAS